MKTNILLLLTNSESWVIVAGALAMLILISFAWVQGIERNKDYHADDEWKFFKKKKDDDNDDLGGLSA